MLNQKTSRSFAYQIIAKFTPSGINFIGLLIFGVSANVAFAEFNTILITWSILFAFLSGGVDTIYQINDKNKYVTSYAIWKLVTGILLATAIIAAPFLEVEILGLLLTLMGLMCSALFETLMTTLRVNNKDALSIPPRLSQSISLFSFVIINLDDISLTTYAKYFAISWAIGLSMAVLLVAITTKAMRYRPSIDCLGEDNFMRRNITIGITLLISTLISNVDYISLTALVSREDLGDYRLAWMVASSLTVALSAYHAVYLSHISNTGGASDGVVFKKKRLDVALIFALVLLFSTIALTVDNALLDNKLFRQKSTEISFVLNCLTNFMWFLFGLEYMHLLKYNADLKILMCQFLNLTIFAAVFCGAIVFMRNYLVVASLAALISSVATYIIARNVRYSIKDSY